MRPGQAAKMVCRGGSGAGHCIPPGPHLPRHPPAPHHHRRRCHACPVLSGRCSSPWSSDPRPGGRDTGAAPRCSVDPAPSPSKYPAPPTFPHLQKLLLLLLLAGDLAQDGLQRPAGGLPAQQPADGWVPISPLHQHPKGDTGAGNGTGQDSLVLDLGAGAGRPRVDNGGPIVENQVLAAELDVLGPCKVPL